jgi:hypothetical protein
MVELKPDLDKIARAQRAIARHAAGQLWFEKDADYLEKLEYELLKFPRAAHDDQVDVISYAAIEADKRAFDWDEAYGIKVCDQCGERYLRNPQNRCDKCGAED